MIQNETLALLSALTHRLREFADEIERLRTKMLLHTLHSAQHARKDTTK